MRVALLLKGTTEKTMQLAGAFVNHGLSSRQAVDALQLLTTTDIVVELTGTLKELNATFNKFGIVVVEPTKVPPNVTLADA